MTVHVTLERYVYAVPSERNARVRYRVDLVGAGGAIECSCKDWSTRRWPNIKAGKPIHTADTLCKHGRAALHHFTAQLLPELSRIEEGKQ